MLEVDCGTGHWLEGVCDHAHEVYGLDLSVGMLAQAQQGRKITGLSQGRAEELPFPTASCDLIYCVNALHHFQCQREFVGQARRVLRQGGALAVFGMIRF